MPRPTGTGALPHYKLDQADVIVGFEADFLGTWISPVEFAKAYQAGRKADKQGQPLQQAHPGGRRHDRHGGQGRPAPDRQA